MALGDEGLLRGIVAPIVARAGYDLEEIVVRPAGRRRLVRVIVDRDGGVDLADAADLSRELSAALDTDDDHLFAGAAYTLEVTSPGTDRPLTAPRHFRRNIGRLLRIDVDEEHTITGRLAGADDERITVLTGTDGLAARTLPLATITRAMIEVEFSPPSTAQMAALERWRDDHAGRIPPGGDVDEGDDQL